MKVMIGLLILVVVFVGVNALLNQGTGVAGASVGNAVPPGTLGKGSGPQLQVLAGGSGI